VAPVPQLKVIVPMPLWPGAMPVPLTKSLAERRSLLLSVASPASTPEPDITNPPYCSVKIPLRISLPALIRSVPVLMSPVVQLPAPVL
jgi:hypothetical protein